MSDYRSERVDRPRDEGLFPARIQEDKKEKQKFTDVPQQDSKMFTATFFHCLKNLFDMFSPSRQLAGKVIDKQAATDNLKQFKQLLKHLTTKDMSSSTDFATELSELWKDLLENFDNIEILERRSLTEVAAFRETMNTIKNYPPDSEYRFGYYLLEQAGKDWLPFPFIEMLKKLYSDHQVDSKRSTLTHWIRKIDMTINHLQHDLPFKKAF